MLKTVSEIWNQLTVDFSSDCLLSEANSSRLEIILIMMEKLWVTGEEKNQHLKMLRSPHPPVTDELVPFLETKLNWLEIHVFPSAQVHLLTSCAFPLCMSLCWLVTTVKTSRVIPSCLHFKLNFNCWCEIKILEYCDF